MREISVFATEGILTLGISDIGPLLGGVGGVGGVVVGGRGCGGGGSPLSCTLAADRFEIIV